MHRLSCVVYQQTRLRETLRGCARCRGSGSTPSLRIAFPPLARALEHISERRVSVRFVHSTLLHNGFETWLGIWAAVVRGPCPCSHYNPANDSTCGIAQPLAIETLTHAFAFIVDVGADRLFYRSGAGNVLSSSLRDGFSVNFRKTSPR